MKKFFSLLAAASLLTCAVSCSSERKDEEVPEQEPFVYEDRKTVLRVGNFGFHEKAFGDYLTFPKDIEIEDVNYCNNNSGYDEALKQFNMDMICGEGPDIIFAGGDLMHDLIAKGTMTDMFALMDEYGGIQREDFLPNVLGGLTVDGKLPAVVDSITIYTAVVKSKYAGEDYADWTVRDLEELYSQMPENMDIIDAANEEVERFMLKNISRNCVDTANYTCDFNDPDFIEALRFCQQHPVDEREIPDYQHMSDSAIADYSRDWETRGLRDAQFIFPVRINGFTSSLGNDVYAYLNREDVTFVGYPSKNGIGSVTSYNTGNAMPYGITESCANKEKAWEVVCSVLRYQDKLEKYMVDDTKGIPVLMSQFQNEYDRSDSYNNSINGEYILPSEVWDDDKTFTLPQDIKDKLRDYIMDAKVDIYYPLVVDDIVYEEAEAVMAGERSPEDAAKIIQNRVSIYLSEKYE